MSAQEFSSPGAHMSGSDTGSSSTPSYVGSTAYRYANSNSSNGINGLSRVLYASGSSGSSANSNFYNGFSLNTPASVLGSLNDAVNNQMSMVGSNNSAYQDYFNQANSFNQNSANRAMKFSAQQAQLNRDFQENMSNTSYQRAVKDLEAAGLNPILAYINGGASTPAGSSASGTSATASGYSLDEGHTGMATILSSIMSNLPQIMIASASSPYLNSGEFKELTKNTTSLVSNVTGSINSVLKGINNTKNSIANWYKKQNDNAVNINKNAH